MQCKNCYIHELSKRGGMVYPKKFCILLGDMNNEHPFRAYKDGDIGCIYCQSTIKKKWDTCKKVAFIPKS